MNFIKKILPAILLFLLLGSYPLPARSKAVKIKIGAGKAVVTLLEGDALLFKKGVAKPKTLSKQSLLAQGDRVTTGTKSRVEIKLPDKSFIRFDEKTTFVLESVAYDQKNQNKDVNINIILGKTWAKVPKFSGSKGRFAITTKTSVAGVRGTDFRMNVNKDNSAVLKVYDGEVVVSKRKDTIVEKTKATLEKPAPVAGPQPVAGPHPVSMEEWTYIVKSLQQINIRPDGTAAKPFRFDIARDLNDWVRWNRMRNELIQQ
ncbi:MAG: FecR domain-containing protein [Desulfobacteraceae bacterium]|nr:FecR domain-containing protein [Desulfobacteraceae bacterium]